jgi:hypothetical protein
MLLAVVSLLLCSCQSGNRSDAGQVTESKMTIKVTSTAFQDGGNIPVKYTCDGTNVSPPLAWSAIPEGAQSIALLMDDPDSPSKTFTHWIVFNLLSSSDGLPEAVPTDKVLSNGAKQGTNDADKIGYFGPCPPSGTHRYVFHVYALDAQLDLDPGVKKNQFKQAISGHILAQGQLAGKYSR